MTHRNDPGQGLAPCVLHLLDALGWRGNRTTLAELLPSDQGPWRITEVLPRLEALGFRGIPRRIRGARPGPLLVPGLLLTPKGDWYCLERRTDEGYEVWSSVLGEKQVLSAEDWASTFSPSRYLGFEEAGPVPESKVTPYWIQDLVSRNRESLGAALGFSLILALFGLVSPLFVGMLYREIDSMTDPGGLVILGLGAILFSLGEVAFLTLRQRLLDRLRTVMGVTLDREILRRVLGFPWAFSHNVGPAAQISRIREFEDLAGQLSRPVTRALMDFPFMTILLVALGLLGGTMVLVPLVAILLFLLMGVFLYPMVRKLDQEAASEATLVQTKLDAVLDQGADLQLWGIEDRWKANLQKAELEAIPPQLARSHLTATFNFLSYGLVSLAGVFAVLVGVEEVMAGRLDGATLLASMMLVWRILDPFRSVFVLLGSIQGSLQTGRRLQKFMALQGEPQADPNRPSLKLKVPSLRVEGFYFKYPQATRFALANVTFEVPTHAFFHISGGPGSGRTTLVHALLGLLEGSNGRITIGGQNIKQYDPMSLRKNIGYLPSSVPILPLSLRDNLRLVRVDAGDEELLEALEEAGLEEEVRGLSSGLDTVLDQGFLPPSVDFFRALGVTRLLLRKAPIWILDEPEQGLGPVRKALLLGALERRRGQITAIILGNDPGFADLARYHALMEQGRFQGLKPREPKNRRATP